MRLHLITILISLFSSVLLANQNTPRSGTAVRPGLEARVFKRLENWDHMAEFRYRMEEHGNFESLTLSSRRHFKHALSLGAYGRYVLGERHYHTWMQDPNDNVWKWKDVDSEKEIHLGLFLQKKIQLSERFVFDVRGSYEYHVENEMPLALFRPGLSWQINPWWISYIRYEAYIPLKTAPSTLYKQGVYLGALWSHFAPLMIGPFVRYERHEWWTSPQFKMRTGEDYRSHDNLYSVGLTFIYSI